MCFVNYYFNAKGAKFFFQFLTEYFSFAKAFDYVESSISLSKGWLLLIFLATPSKIL